MANNNLAISASKEQKKIWKCNILEPGFFAVAPERSQARKMTQPNPLVTFRYFGKSPKIEYCSDLYEIFAAYNLCVMVRLSCSELGGTVPVYLPSYTVNNSDK